MPNISPIHLPLVHILATGGTIAGKSLQSTGVGEYASGVVSVAALLSDMPSLGKMAKITFKQIAEIGSEDMTEEIWFRLAEATAQAIADPAVAGVVILHGTDTMEETAFFLDCILTADKPVVMTGAMRPADSSSADGPANILHAVRLAGAGEAAGYGVMVVMDSMVYSAQTVMKSDTMRLGAFTATGAGALGQIMGDRPLLYAKPPNRTGVQPLFSITNLRELPRVEIIYGHAGQERLLIDAAVAAGAAGIVHAGVGMGNVHKTARIALMDAMQQGIAVVCASRVPCGMTPWSGWMREAGFIASGL